MSNIPLYALPGLLNDNRVWQHQLPILSRTNSVIAVDLTEHNSIVKLASAALSQAQAERFALAGFSLGGYVALEIIRQAPDRVAALALLDTSARPDSPQAVKARQGMIALSQTDFDAVVNSFLPRVVHPSRVGDQSLINTLVEMAHTVGKDAFIRQQQAAINRTDSRPFLKDIHCPTLVLCGREDLITPLELHEELASGISNSQLVIIEQCGHMSPLEHPHHVTEALAAWLSTIGGVKLLPLYLEKTATVN